MARNFNGSDVMAGLDRLAGPLKESLARRMAVSGGQVLRNAAQENARVPFTGPRDPPLKGNSTWVFNPKGSSNSSDEAGSLADAIYLARDQGNSSETRYAYRISWNNTYAWWGRLREFGYYIRFAFFKDEHGMYHTIKSQPLENPIRIPPNPFLAPAYDQFLQAARAAMIATGQEEAPKLIAQAGGG